eukprot:scaffold54960_cov18-Tisochrysis_lutea.AAC.1
MAWLVVAEVSLYFQIISPSQLRARRILATSPCTWAVWGVRVGDPAGRIGGGNRRRVISACGSCVKVFRFCIDAIFIAMVDT